MPTSPRVGIACLNTGERVAFCDWLRAANLEPVVLVEACFVNTDLSGQAFECVVADASLLKGDFLMALRRGNPKLPIVAVGEIGDPAAAALDRRNVPFHARPLDQSTLLLAVSLAMAESRPSRRSLRRLVPRLPSKIEDTAVVLLDVSPEGLRVELPRDQGAKLGPLFHVQVPIFSVAITVRRVWVKAGSVPGRVECGATLSDGDERSLMRWRTLVDNATSPAATARVRAEAAKVDSGHFLDRVGDLIAGAPLVGAFTSHWRHNRRAS